MTSRKKGQGALEYLLIIGGVLVVAAVVLSIGLNMLSTGKNIGTETGGIAGNLLRNELGVGCTPNCSGKECGADGCGGSCPPGCGSGEGCIQGNCCTNDCTWSIAGASDNTCHYACDSDNYGFSGCDMYSVCDGKPFGSTVCYDNYSTVECCTGSVNSCGFDGYGFNRACSNGTCLP